MGEAADSPVGKHQLRRGRIDVDGRVVLVGGPSSHLLAAHAAAPGPVPAASASAPGASHDLPPGARVVVRRSSRPVLLARLHPAVFTDRLVRKFRLPVTGWRGMPGGAA